MLSLKKIIFAVFIALLSNGCSLSETPSKNYSSKQTELPVKYSSLFKLFQTDSGYVVSIKEPYSQHYKTYFFSQYGNSAEAITIPVRKSVCLSSMYVSMFVALGKTELISAVDNINYQTEKKDFRSIF